MLGSLKLKTLHLELEGVTSQPTCGTGQRLPSFEEMLVQTSMHSELIW